MTSLMKELFKVEKPIIGMVHLQPLPGSPRYNPSKDIEEMVKAALKDAKALESGGVDGVIVSNESDTPFLFRVGPEIVAAMTYIATRIKDEISIPMGIDVLWGDARASLAIAKALGSKFIRTLMSGVYSSDLGLINTEGAKVMRYRRYIGADDVRIFVYINPEFASPLSPRPLTMIARTLKWLGVADAYCVSGFMPGVPPEIEEIERIRKEVPDVPIIANTGINKENVAEYLKYVDGAIVGTAFKVGDVTLNPIDEKKVVEFMKIVKSARGY